VDARNGQVLAGNHRVKAARELGMAEIPVTLISPDSDEHALRILLRDNRESDLAHYDNEVLTELLEHLAGTEGGLAGSGYTDADLADLSDLVAAPSLDDLEKEFGAGGGDPSDFWPTLTIRLPDEVLDRWADWLQSRDDPSEEHEAFAALLAAAGA
jgi:hypothetical protein